MFVTYDDLIQLGLFIVALIGLVYEICNKNAKNNRPMSGKLGGYF